jgi:hypothetical protein
MGFDSMQTYIKGVGDFLIAITIFDMFEDLDLTAGKL